MIDMVLITAAGVVTWVLRASFVTLAGNHALPAPVNSVLGHARIAVLAALLATATTNSGTATAGELEMLARVAGIAVAGGISWKWRNLTFSLAGGFAVYWALAAVTSLLA